MATATIVSAPSVRPIVEIGVGSQLDAEGLSVWQPAATVGTIESRWQDATTDGSTDAATSHWVGDEPTWLDVSCHVRDVSTFCGRDRSIETWQVGTATVIVDNAGGWADFPLVVEPEHPLLSVRPGREIRIGVSIDEATPVYLWRGYIDRTDPGYDPEVGETVTIECIDAKGEAGRAFAGELAAAAGASENAALRVGRVLNAVAWPSYRRDLASDSVPLLATTLGAQATDLLDVAADSAGGSVFGGLDGKVAYRQRDWQVFTASDPIAGTIGNFGGAGDACPVSWELSWGREDISTRVLLSRPADTSPVTRENVPARRRYGAEDYERSDLETSSTTVLGQIADRWLVVRSPDRMPRVAAVTLDAATAANVAAVMTVASPYTAARLRCQHRSPVDGRTVFSRLMIVVGAEHSITPEAWTARIALDDASPYQVQSTARWSDGTADTARWESNTTPAPYSTWAEAV